MSHPLLNDAVDILRNLTAFDTIPAHSNLPLADYVCEVLRTRGGVDFARLNGGENKVSLLATIGPSTDGGVVLSGHTDVVDVAGQQWTREPFTLSEDDGKLYARGACDMKGFLACALAAAPTFAAAKLRVPVHFAFSRDEEIACAGTQDMLQMIRDSGMKPATAIIGEPTRMGIIAGHKSGLTMRTIFHGMAAHSSMPKAGVSTIPYAAQFISHLAKIESDMANRADRASPFNPPHATINVGTIHGGTALNIFAARCEMEWHFRGVPTDDLDTFAAMIDDYLQNELLPQMQTNGHPVAIENIRVSSYPGLADEESSAIQLAQQLTADLSEPIDSKKQVVSFGTEAGYFQRAGIAAVVIGPGDIDQAHKPDEYIEKSQLDLCLQFLDKLCVHLQAS